MLVVLNESVTENQIKEITDFINNSGATFQFSRNGTAKSLVVLNNQNKITRSEIENFVGVQEASILAHSYKLASREVHPQNTIVEVDGIEIGGDNFSLIAGPCSVENEEQIFKIAHFLVQNNIKIMRGGAFKPRTSPYSFQGLGSDGLQILSKVRKETGLKIVSEAMDVVTIEEVSEHVDIVQIGSRSMQNYPLLKKAGEIDKPVLLKRGFSATLEELLLSAEYVLNAGNPNVILCERGIRTFNDHSRNMLDLAAIPVLKELTHLPIIVDPSHGSGDRNKILPLSKAALVIGSDGLLIEIHPDPDQALSDGIQSLDFDGFNKVQNELKKLAIAVGMEIED